MNAPIDDIIADDLYKCQHQSDEPAVRSRAEIFDDDTMSRLPKNRPRNKRKKSALYGYLVALVVMSITALLVFPQPVSWILAAGCYVPIGVALTVRKKKGQTWRS